MIPPSQHGSGAMCSVAESGEAVGREQLTETKTVPTLGRPPADLPRFGREDTSMDLQPTETNCMLADTSVAAIAAWAWAQHSTESAKHLGRTSSFDSLDSMDPIGFRRIADGSAKCDSRSRSHHCPDEENVRSQESKPALEARMSGRASMARSPAGWQSVEVVEPEALPPSRTTQQNIPPHSQRGRGIDRMIGGRDHTPPPGASLRGPSFESHKSPRFDSVVRVPEEVPASQHPSLSLSRAPRERNPRGAEEHVMRAPHGHLRPGPGERRGDRDANAGADVDRFIDQELYARVVSSLRSQGARTEARDAPGRGGDRGALDRVVRGLSWLHSGDPEPRFTAEEVEATIEREHRRLWLQRSR
eukprot:CAMPEP_0204529528 /NCGR_PEP_ID=MMETSP0661-20131031/10118_1 /ASSEMBLY_ACC=CAM_ASM_000606 /TAXON_ID=109239 /ORGANISM="Alexandrium margalefi, Strain AMGDE01CS-322" /LENGTH=359 /DNA_ID=CAMNT_0051535561 /DNA_START=57 /DNA_END=1136 /DNA_ORIENTATION=+